MDQQVGGGLHGEIHIVDRVASQLGKPLRATSKQCPHLEALFSLAYGVPVGGKWHFTLRGDVGGFGLGADFTWHALTRFTYQHSEWFSWYVGYRAIAYDYEDDGQGFDYQRYDLLQHGPGAGPQTGLGDVLQSLFFSPKAPTASGWIWGAGPVLLLPTGSDDLLTTDKWGAGPTAVMLKQSNGWTRGVLANHVYSFAGDDDRADISSTFVQPFLTSTTPDQWTFTVNTESTYDWENEEWAVPVNVSAQKLTRFGTQLVSLGGGVRYWFDSPDAGAEGFGLRFTVTLLFPR